MESVCHPVCPTHSLSLFRTKTESVPTSETYCVVVVIIFGNLYIKICHYI